MSYEPQAPIHSIYHDLLCILTQNLTPIQTMMCGANESSNQYQSKHKQ